MNNNLIKGKMGPLQIKRESNKLYIQHITLNESTSNQTEKYIKSR